MFRIFTKINVLRIISDHIATLKDYNNPRHSRSDIILFFITPFFAGLVLVLFQVLLTKDLVGTLINVFAIFAGLLFNLLVLLYDAISKVEQSSNSLASLKLRIDTLEQIFSNISFKILLALVNVIILAISILFNGKEMNFVFSFLVFYLVILFTLSLLMVLKRIHKLLSDEIIEKRKSLNNTNP